MSRISDEIWLTNNGSMYYATTEREKFWRFARDQRSTDVPAQLRRAQLTECICWCDVCLWCRMPNAEWIMDCRLRKAKTSKSKLLLTGMKFSPSALPAGRRGGPRSSMSGCGGFKPNQTGSVFPLGKLNQSGKIKHPPNTVFLPRYAVSTPLRTLSE